MLRGHLFVRTLLAGLVSTLLVGTANAAPYFDGFEGAPPANSWQANTTTVASGTNGIPSADGGFHAQVTAGAYTRFGGYNSSLAATGFRCALDVYLDMNVGAANDTRFDYTVAVSDPAGNHRRDFIFNGGFYNDATAPGSGNRFVFSASNNVPGWPKNPGRAPVAIDQTGWYTLEHTFYDDGSGVLAVDLAILDSVGTVVGFWTLSDPSDLIGVTVGGNRYGWFPYNGFPFLAIDNTVRVGDSDGDGVPDDVDACPDSDLSPTVVIDAIDTGIANVLFPDGCTISDRLAECAAGASNHGQFVRCVTQLANQLHADGVITNKEKATLTKAAARSSLP